MAGEKKMSHGEFMRELQRRILKGIKPADPILRKFKGSPGKAAAQFARKVMESDQASAEDLSTMRFVG